jgi:AcrR family transcriptional regulator
VNIDSHKDNKMATEKVGTEIRREQIAQAALSLVASQGIRALTVGKVAQMIGLVPSAIYRHFKNKDEIIDAVLDLFEKRLKKNLAEVVTENVNRLEALRRLLMRHIQLIMEYQIVPKILFSDEVFAGRPELKNRLFRIFQGFIKGVAEIISEGQQQKMIRGDISADSMAIMFIGLLQPSAFFWYLSHGQFDMVKQVNLGWQVFVDSIAIGKRDTSEKHHEEQE